MKDKKNKYIISYTNTMMNCSFDLKTNKYFSFPKMLYTGAEFKSGPALYTIWLGNRKIGCRRWNCVFSYQGRSIIYLLKNLLSIVIPDSCYVILGGYFWNKKWLKFYSKIPHRQIYQLFKLKLNNYSKWQYNISLP